ncbi:MAG: OsmC family protein [Ignavibacteriaceae bacterium]|nr:OsmC family protein [Ignavibacteriaceae bacterium]
MITRSGSAVWKGDLLSGDGTLSMESGILKDTPYNFKSRFEQGKETNPEELMGAAHAACFSMALANGLSKAGYKVISVETTDKVHLEKLESGFTITKIDVITQAKVEGIDKVTFDKIAEETKVNCPVSKALVGPMLILTATLL